MPVDETSLDALARRYVGAMTSVRARRVHRLLMREFARFDLVVPATTEDGRPVLLALADDGRVAACRTDGRGAAVNLAEWAGLAGATVTTSFDLTRDSLPAVRWTLRHAGLAGDIESLTISADELTPVDRPRVVAILRQLGG